MRLRTKYILFVVILHLIALVLSWFIFKNDEVLFIASEIFILISILIAFQLYKQLLQPLQLLMRGAEAIKDRDFNVKFVATGTYEMDQLINVYNHMIDELRNERIRQEQQHLFLEKLIHTSPTGILILDYDERIHEANPKALKLLEIEEKAVIGKSIDEVMHPVLQQIKQLASGESKTITYNGVNTYKLQKSHFIDRGFARHFVMIEELTAEILAAEKKAYGKVIRMMAHEVNNTIGPVNSIINSALRTDKLWKEAEAETLQNALQVAFERNNNLNLFMRNFAEVVRLPEPVKKNIDLHTLIRSIAQLMEMKAGEKQVQFLYNLSEKPFTICADQQQLEQVIINIIKNAIEAIEDSGIISFETNTSTKRLVITDSGKGISQHNVDQLFSPFFSTKKDGQGIGLTLVKEILLNHGFEFSLQTVEPGKTKFEIRFGE
jgi:two-component system, NtrC family, nitrogen regulation sensor histidine kinase NtrY